jgi:hypothetical protein
MQILKTGKNMALTALEQYSIAMSEHSKRFLFELGEAFLKK